MHEIPSRFDEKSASLGKKIQTMYEKILGRVEEEPTDIFYLRGAEIYSYNDTFFF